MPQVSEWLSKQGVGAGQWYTEAIAFTERAARAGDLSADALRLLFLLRLHTIRYRSERAITMSNNKRRLLTPNDLVKGSGLSRQNVRRGLVELEDAGYAERKPVGDGGLREGNVQLWCWTVPRAAKTPRPVNKQDYGLPPEVVSMVRRFRIPLPSDFVATGAYKAFVVAAAGCYKEAEMVAARALKEAFFVGPDAPRLSEGTVRGSVRVEGASPSSGFVDQNPPSIGRTSDSDGSKTDRPTEYLFENRIREWLEAQFKLPTGIEKALLWGIAATIESEDHFRQFQEAARRVKKPRGWKVFVTVALDCQRHHEKYMAAAAGAEKPQESDAAKWYRELKEKEE